MKTGMILVDVQSYMSSVSLVEEGKLKEHYVQYKDSSYITGNIYKGKVENLLTGLQSAFVNFGSTRNGFLSVEEIPVHKTVLGESGVVPKKLNVKEGDYVMVQATKEEIGTKGARLTTTVTLPGRYVIYLPTLDFVGVSNKITDEETRDKLIKKLTKLAPEGCGFIARTACLEAKSGEITEESKRLIDQWHKIQNAYNQTTGISQVYSDGDLIFRTVRDMLSGNIDKIICNDRETCQALKDAMRERNVRFYDRVHLYEGAYDMYDAFNVLGEVDKLLDRRVTVKSGISLVFDYPEALTVIDVNTAKFTRGNNHEETVFQANMEAAREIARQIRLRNIGGIIIVDFVDMQEEEHKQAVVDELRKELLFDRTKTRVLGMSGLGLVEITRKKVGKELSTVLLNKCPYCDGDALAHSVEYVARKIKANLKRLFAETHDSVATVTVNPMLLEALIEGRHFSHDCETIWQEKRIYLVPEPNVLNREFTVRGMGSGTVQLPPSAKLLH